MTRKILFYGCDIGGANALGEVISAILRMPKSHRIELSIYANKLAYKSWQSNGFQVKRLLKDAQIKSMVSKADVVVTATSWPRSKEFKFWKAARSLGKPSMALVDFWTHYKERFYDVEEKKMFWPDKIAVMDNHAMKSLLEIGAPQEHVEVVGQPFLERRYIELQKSKKPFKKDFRLLFVSQPVHIVPSSKIWGYDEFEAFSCVVDALNQLEPELSHSLLVRLHPRENKRIFEKHLKSLKINFTWSFDEEKKPDMSIGYSQIIIGISSMLLIEAGLAGKNVISVQPNLACEDPFIFSKLGYCPLARNVNELKKIILENLKGKCPAQSKLDSFIKNNSGASQRVINLLLK